MENKKKKKHKKPSDVCIPSGDDKLKVGEYDAEKKLFIMTRNKTEHFNERYNGWGLDLKVLDFLVNENATLRVKDKETKWEYECSAGDMKYYGQLVEKHNIRPFVFLDLSHWTVKVARNRSFIVKCSLKECRFNFADNCLNGAVVIGEKGECTSYQPQ